MYTVIWMYDGCPDKDATIPMASVDECKEAIRRLQAKHKDKLRADPKLDLDILDLSTGRLVSYVL